MSPGPDDAAALRAGDPSGMLAAFAATGDQLSRAYETARAAPGVPTPGGVRSVVCCGMGGSAAGADAVAAAFAEALPIPLVVVRGYEPPAWAGDQDLVVCVSYSGDTEETVAALAAAVKRGCPAVAVSGGGVLAEQAEAQGVAAVRIPAEAPVPRAGLGALAGGVLGTLVAVGVLPDAEPTVSRASALLDRLGAELRPQRSPPGNEAKDVATWVGPRIPVIWGSEGVTAAAAWRWKTAFNENAEVPAFSSVLPELDHHEVVGWSRGGGERFAILILREPAEHDSVVPRLEATLGELRGSGLEWREVHARGDEPLARCLSLAMVGDMASAYHALARGIDPAAMDSLTRIKRRLESRG